jgi:hypothetical protein
MFMIHFRLWVSNRENLIFLALIVAHLVPLWAFQYFPSQDGPSHLNNANVIREYSHPELTVFREYYILNKQFNSNWLGHILLAGLMNMAPALIAEKILLSIYVIFLPISVRYALRAIHPDSQFISFLVFPLIYNNTLHFGFYNFSMSLPVFFLFVGYWMKHQERFKLREMGILTLLSVMLYFSHIVSLVMAWVMVTILAMWPTILTFARQAREHRIDLRASWNTFQSKALFPLLSFFLTFTLVLSFLHKHPLAIAGAVSAPNQNELPQTFLQKFLRYVSRQIAEWPDLGLTHLVSYQAEEILVVQALVAGFAILSIYLIISKLLHRNFNCWDQFILVFVAYTIIYFITPESFSIAGFMHSRLILYPFFILILWFGAQHYHRILRKIIIGTSVSIAMTLVLIHSMKYAEINDYLEEYLSGMHLIERNTTLLPLCFSCSPSKMNTADGRAGRNLTHNIYSFLHASGYIAAERRIVEFTNYEANTSVFPTQFRPNLNPYQNIGNFENLPSKIDFLNYPLHTGGRVDYVLVWDVTKWQINHDENTKSIFKQLEEGFDLIYISPQRGLMQLYRRKNHERGSEKWTPST